MGSPFRIPITSMKTFLLSLTLVLLALQGSKAADVTSCLQCTGGSVGECAEGTGTGSPCGGEADGCYVAASDTEVEGHEHAWVRGCCNGNSTDIGACSEIHETQDMNGNSTRVDQSWCDTNNCNTMDPQSSAAALVPALTLLMAALAVITTNL